MGKMSQQIWYSIISSGTECVEISTKAEISAQDFLWIVTFLVGVLNDVIEISISNRIILESAVEKVQ